jgi:hypothetical protein
MVIRVISVPDALDLPEFDEASRAVLGWDNIGHLPLSRPGVQPLSPGEPFENPARFPTATTRDLSAPAGRSICGNGNSVCSTSQQEPMAMRRHFASPGAALLLCNTVAVLPAIGYC